MRTPSVLSLLSALLVACDPPGAATSPSATGAPPASGIASSATGSATSVAASSAVPTTDRPTAPSSSAAVVAPPGAAEMTRLARASNAFGFDLWQRRKSATGNQVLSPASITTALAMTWGGARGETAAQMKKVLHLDGDAKSTMNVSGQLARSLEDPARPIQFRIANQLFGEKTYAFEKTFLDDTRSAYGAPLELTDFAGGHEAARTRINQWVETKTEKRIVDLVPADGVTKDTRLVLVNAIYFLGDWASPFKKEATQDQPFAIGGGEKKPVTTMVQGGSFRHAAKDGASIVELPYVGGQMSMVLVVPDAVDGLAALEGSLDAKKLDGWTAALEVKEVMLFLPRFEVAPRTSIRLGDDLKAMGMPLAFDQEKADFTGIAKPTSPQDRLSIGHVFHKAFVKVDEKGTEAAAATAVSMPKGTGMPPKRIEMRVDRPFFFAIRDVASGLVLFMGRVVDPTQK